MTELIATGVVVTALLAIAYITGSELCVPAARYALRSRELRLLLFASRLVSLGERAWICAGATLLLIVQDQWHCFTATPAGKAAGVAATGVLAAATVRELSGRFHTRRGIVMSRSLDLVLPASGRRRAEYERSHHLLESGSRAERNTVLRCLLQ
ncbi:MAG: hypothetical protein PVF08_00715 [Gammaproteobacteria bacterium]|jgi:hypothetical protein